MMPRIAVAGIIAVAATLLVVPAPASAATAAPAAPATDASTAIAASVDARTYLDDIRSGRITAEQLVEQDLAAQAGEARASGAAAPDRQAITRQVAEEIAGLRAGEIPSDGPDAERTTGTAVAHDPLATDAHWWNKLIHWKTVRISAFSLVVGGSMSSAILGSIAGGCGALGALACAAVSSISAWAAGVLATLAGSCLESKHHGIYLKIPDFWKSHCGD